MAMGKTRKRVSVSTTAATASPATARTGITVARSDYYFAQTAGEGGNPKIIAMYTAVRLTEPRYAQNIKAHLLFCNFCPTKPRAY